MITLRGYDADALREFLHNEINATIEELNAAGERRPTRNNAEEAEESLLGGPSAPVA